MLAAPQEVHAIAGAVMDAQFADALTYGLHIAGVPVGKTVEAARRSRLGRARPLRRVHHFPNVAVCFSSIMR